MNVDYIVIGGGSAGCVLGSRLSADGERRVLLLEAGSRDWNPAIHVPGLLARASQTPGIMWGYQGEPDPTLSGVALDWMAGRVLGGSSSVNGMVWVRGHRADFDRWSELGCPGWDWKSVEGYFRRSESFERRDPSRGTDGPVHVTTVDAPHVMTEAFVAAAAAAGHPFTSDYNAERQEGVAYGQANVRRGLRQSAARAYLGSAWRRRNLKVATGALVERILFEGTRAVGVEYTRGGKKLVARASREVIVSAGAIASPKILMLSGVGPSEHLRSRGIDVVADNPGVGGNLSDHPCVAMLWDVDVPTFGMDYTAMGIARHGFSYLQGKGPAASGIFHAVLFSKVDPSSPRTEIEAGFAPLGIVGADAGDTTAETLTSAGTHDVTRMEVLDRASVTAVISMLHPRSRGIVKLRSANAADPPLIEYELFGDERDLSDLIAGCRQVRAVFETSPLVEHVVREALPGSAVKTDEEWEGFLRSANAWGSKHPSGTCKMGIDEYAVVDPELKVRGVQGLRVADASIMPEVTSGNTNAPTIMIGEKAADMIMQA
jgi:choline dehydrogenase